MHVYPNKLFGQTTEEDFKEHTAVHDVGFATRIESRLFVFQPRMGFKIARLGLAMVETLLTKVVQRLCQLHLQKGHDGDLTCRICRCCRWRWRCCCGAL